MFRECHQCSSEDARANDFAPFYRACKTKIFQKTLFKLELKPKMGLFLDGQGSGKVGLNNKNTRQPRAPHIPYPVEIEKSSDVNRPAKTARPGLGRFGPSHFGLVQARPQPGQAGPSQMLIFSFVIYKEKSS